MSETIYTLRASSSRRAMAVGVLGALGFLLIYLAVTQPPAELAYTFLMVGIAGVVLWNARLMWIATDKELVLTEETLEDSMGRVVCRIEDIASVDRGMFAFKPSNGFVIKLKTPQQRGWAPGIWWRFGKRIGIGGVTGASDGKGMADVITMIVAKRDGLLD